MHGGREGEKITSVKKSCKNKGINWYMLLFLKNNNHYACFCSGMWEGLAWEKNLVQLAWGEH